MKNIILCKFENLWIWELFVAMSKARKERKSSRLGCPESRLTHWLGKMQPLMCDGHIVPPSDWWPGVKAANNVSMSASQLPTDEKIECLAFLDTVLMTQKLIISSL